MGEPIVIQGTAVSAPAQTTQAVTYGAEFETPSSNNPEPAKTGCKDPLFAILFYCNVAALLIVVVLYGIPAMRESDSSTNYLRYVTAALVFGVTSFVAGLAGLFMLITCPALMIKVGLIFSVAVAIAYCVYAFLYLNLVFGILAVVFAALMACYARGVWSRIPFAAINMLTAATAVKANLGVTIFAIFFTILEVAWLVLWAIAMVGVYDKTTKCDANSQCDINYGILFGLFVCLFFTQQVLQSCVHVNVAGTVATWWVAPNESGCCSKGVCNSFIRTVTTSFGSICFGSLIVAIIQALRALASAARGNDDAGFLACIAECILACLQSIVEYFNKWAFIYVGVYGFGYIEAGKNVMQLFRDRGWEAIIADDLVGGAIFMLCCVLGLIIGVVGVVYASINSEFKTLAQDSLGAAFGIGFVAGLFVASVILSTVASGVNTVIVMFADAPQEFNQNHPELSRKMRETWTQFYPGSV